MAYRKAGWQMPPVGWAWVRSGAVKKTEPPPPPEGGTGALKYKRTPDFQDAFFDLIQSCNHLRLQL